MMGSNRFTIDAPRYLEFYRQGRLDLDAMAIELVEPAEVPRVVLSDADDDHVIAAAVAAGATLVVSGDSDLLGIGSYRGIEIISAAMALETVRAAGQAA